MTALPRGLDYRVAFVSPAEEQALVAEIAKLPLAEARYREYTAKRRIASFGSHYDFAAGALVKAPPMPRFLAPLRERVASWLAIASADFCHALVTEYRPGTALGWHRDAPCFEVVAGVSLGEAARMRFRPYPPAGDARAGVLALELEPCSAYAFRGDVRWRWQHAISPTPGLRYSVTFRTLRGR